VTPAGRRLITTFGLGFMRPASGTWGSLPPCIVAAVLVYPLGGLGHYLWYPVMLAFIAVFSWACVKFGDGAEAEFGKKDPGQVVADETAGMALTLLFMPWWWLTPDPLSKWFAIGVAFILFRIADIVKVPPARGLQSLKGGWGILVDDLVAAVQAGLILLALFWWLHRQYPTTAM
jgi:phosphatidylglycerophosphatase A